MHTKEQLLYYFIHKPIRLHYSDRKFFLKLTEIIRTAKKITTGQASLFDRIVTKYAQQLSGTNLSVEEMTKLPWKVTVYETSKEYTSARVSWIDNNVVIRVPTNNKFIQRFDGIRNNPYTWNRDAKAYIADFSTFALKSAYNILPKYFPEVRYCSRIKELFNPLEQYADIVIWDPTLVRINNEYYVAANNDVLENLLPSKLNDDPKTLFMLSQLGIKIHPTLIDTPLKKFAAEFNTEVDITELDKVVGWLKELGVRQVLLGRGVSTTFSKTRRLFDAFTTDLTAAKVQYTPLVYSYHNHIVKKPVLFQYHGNENMKFVGPAALSKCVFIKNSTPIEVK